ncbi:MAG: DUF3793 family protein [Lachnospiraceae bacterium]
MIGFIENSGHNYKCSGCWKVYCDECESRRLSPCTRSAAIFTHGSTNRAGVFFSSL